MAFKIFLAPLFKLYRFSPNRSEIKEKHNSLIEFRLIPYLGRISFFAYNDLEQAIDFTKQVLESFNPEGERKVIKYILLSSQASYLEKMHKDEETMKTIDLLLAEQDQWYHNIDIILNMLEIQANLPTRQGYYDQALKYAEKGIELARTNKNVQRAVELLTTIGNICNTKKDYEEAEEWYLLALQLKGKVTSSPE